MYRRKGWWRGREVPGVTDEGNLVWGRVLSRGRQQKISQNKGEIPFWAENQLPCNGFAKVLSRLELF